MARYAGDLYVHSRTVGDLIAALCLAILRQDPAFFDDIPVLSALDDPADKEKELVKLARDCGLYHDFGLFKMNVERLKHTRPLLEEEARRIRLHTVSGGDDLARRRSTAIYADIARGHHSSYAESEEDPSGYERLRSPFRKLTDAAAVAEWLTERTATGPDGESLCMSVEERLQRMTGKERARFSPPVLSYLEDGELRAELNRILMGDGRAYYEEIFARLTEA